MWQPSIAFTLESLLFVDCGRIVDVVRINSFQAGIFWEDIMRLSPALDMGITEKPINLASCLANMMSPNFFLSKIRPVIHDKFRFDLLSRQPPANE